MSVSLAGAQRFVERRFAGWTLRARLLAVLIALLALMCIIFGLCTQVVARHYLVGQLDTQLRTVSLHAVHDVNLAGNPSPTDPDAGLTGSSMPSLRFGPGTVDVVVYGDGSISGGVNVSGFNQVATTAAENAALRKVPADDKPHTVDIPGLGDSRVLIAPTPNATNGAVASIVALPFNHVNGTLLQLGITEICVTIAGLIAVGLVGETIIRRTLRPLNRVAMIATRVSEMELGRGEVALKMRVAPADTDSRTEIGQVGASLNRLLGHVSNALAVRQASEVRVRQFVADASHELRTPLAAIRGYAELTRRFGNANLPDDVVYAMGRVESESARMTGLVEDLLLLARLDAGRPLDRFPVDLSILVVDVVSDAHVAGRDHEWSLDLPDSSVTIIGDTLRLHQVLANLLANARVHTPPGTKVTVVLAPTAGGGAALTVVDDGPGIPESLIPELFERFARGDSSRSRAAGSTGLGLAIVAAVVDAHGGTVEVSSQPGETRFVVTLPPEPPPEPSRPVDSDRAADIEPGRPDGIEAPHDAAPKVLVS